MALGGRRARGEFKGESLKRIACEERDLSLAEAYRAAEMFCSGTMGELAAVTRVDGRMIGDGHDR